MTARKKKQLKKFNQFLLILSANFEDIVKLIQEKRDSAKL